MDSEIEVLKRKISGRPIFILLNGPSIKFLEERIEEYKDKDICYLVVNEYYPVEDHILSKIGRKPDILSMYNPYSVFYTKVKDDRVEDLLRSGGVAIVGSKIDLFKQNFSKYADRIIRFNPEVTPGENDNPEYFNSLSRLLHMFTYHGIENIYLWGCDGYCDDYDKLYYKNYERIPVDSRHTGERRFPGRYQLESDYVNKMFDGVDRKIYNCTKGSRVTVFQYSDGLLT